MKDGTPAAVLVKSINFSPKTCLYMMVCDRFLVWGFKGSYESESDEFDPMLSQSQENNYESHGCIMMEAVIGSFINFTDTASPQWRVAITHAGGQELFATDEEAEARELHREIMLRRFGFDIGLALQLPDREN
jgi:hypothetical protein